jgi:hypothetical protein
VAGQDQRTAVLFFSGTYVVIAIFYNLLWRVAATGYHRHAAHFCGGAGRPGGRCGSGALLPRPATGIVSSRRPLAGQLAFFSPFFSQGGCAPIFS